MPILLSVLLALGLFASPAGTPFDGEPKARQGLFAITNATIVTVTNGTIENGTIVIDGDRIVALGTDVQIPAGAEVIDGAGLSVYPGLIDSGSQLGLVEVGSLSETRDFAEIGTLNPHMDALTAVNPNSVLIPVTRVGGVTTVLTEPSSGLVPGRAALINLHGYTPEQMLVADVQPMMIEFPQTGRRGWWDRRSDEEIEKAAEKAIKTLNDAFDSAELYARIDSAYQASGDPSRKPEYLPQMIAMLPVVRGEAPVIIKVDKAADIEKAIEWVEERGLERVSFSGVAEGWRVADRIAAAGIPCLVGPVLSIPTRQSDRFDKAYANAGLLKDAGVEIAIRSGETENTRNLPFHAGFAAAYGLGKEDALRAVTIGPAQIFGVADQLGSLETGKRASLIVTDGDPFEPSTEIRHVFIDGWMMPMESRHTRLYDEFLQREPGLTKEPQPMTNPATVTGEQN